MFYRKSDVLQTRKESATHQSDLRHAQHRQEAARIVATRGDSFNQMELALMETRHSTSASQLCQAHFSQGRQDSPGHREDLDVLLTT